MNERVKTATLRAELAEIIGRVCSQRSRATIMRYGEPIAAVVSIQELEELDHLRSLYNIDDKPKTAA